VGKVCRELDRYGEFVSLTDRLLSGVEDADGWGL